MVVTIRPSAWASISPPSSPALAPANRTRSQVLKPSAPAPPRVDSRRGRFALLHKGAVREVRAPPVCISQRLATDSNKREGSEQTRGMATEGLPVRIVLPSLSDTTFVLVRLRSEEHTSELQSQSNLVCRLLLEKKK